MRSTGLQGSVASLSTEVPLLVWKYHFTESGKEIINHVTVSARKSCAESAKVTA